jgi:hypothetical protein
MVNVPRLSCCTRVNKTNYSGKRIGVGGSGRAAGTATHLPTHTQSAHGRRFVTSRFVLGVLGQVLRAPYDPTRQMSDNGMQKRWKELRWAAGLPWVTGHVLRYQCITKNGRGWRRPNHGHASGRPCHGEDVVQVQSGSRGFDAREDFGSVQNVKRAARPKGSEVPGRRVTGWAHKICWFHH